MTTISTRYNGRRLRCTMQQQLNMSSYNAALIPQEHSSQAPHTGPVQHRQPDHTNHPWQVQQGRQPATTQHGLSGMNDLLPGNQLHMTNRYTTHTPAMLQDIQCYADASTPLDQASMTNRLAGIGVFIVNTQMQPTQTVYIKAKLTNSSSVIMAEAAALALAAAVANSIWTSTISTSYLTVNSWFTFLMLQINLILQTGELNILLNFSPTTQGAGDQRYSRFQGV